MSSIIRRSLFGHTDLEKTAIDLLRQYEPEEGYYLANSGGKDSGVLRHLAIKSGVKFDAHSTGLLSIHLSCFTIFVNIIQKPPFINLSCLCGNLSPLKKCLPLALFAIAVEFSKKVAGKVGL